MSDSMTVKNETRYLRSAGLLSFALGLLFLVSTLPEMLSLKEGWSAYVKTGFGVVEVFLFFVMMFYLIKNITTARAISNGAFWLGQFDDEFLTHTNMRGFKDAFHVLFLVLLTGMLVNGVFPAWTESQNISVFSKFVTASGLLGYSVPVLKTLYSEDS